MPEPGYAGGEPPGFVSFLVGTAIIVILLLLLRSCM